MKKALVAAAAVALLSSCDTLTEERDPSADCLTGTWWVGGDTGHAEMHPGRDCVACHKRNDGPPLALGGTVYPINDQADECYGIEGVTVEVSALPVGTAPAVVTHRLVTNAAGNFYIEGDESVLPRPYKISLVAGLEPPGAVTAAPIAMNTAPHTGDCAFCHSRPGERLPAPMPGMPPLAPGVKPVLPGMVILSGGPNGLPGRIDLRHSEAAYLAPAPGAGGTPAAPAAAGGTGGM
jgi:cytochrome c553